MAGEFPRLLYGPNRAYRLVTDAVDLAAALGDGWALRRADVAVVAPVVAPAVEPEPVRAPEPEPAPAPVVARRGPGRPRKAH